MKQATDFPIGCHIQAPFSCPCTAIVTGYAGERLQYQIVEICSRHQEEQFSRHVETKEPFEWLTIVEDEFTQWVLKTRQEAGI